MNNKHNKTEQAMMAREILRKAIMLSNFNKPISGYTPPTLSSMIEVKVIRSNKGGK